MTKKVASTESSFAEEYLDYPDLFPARLAGEAWGKEELVLGFPGGPYRLRGLTGTQKEALSSRFAGLVPREDAGGTPLEACFFRAPMTDFLEVDLRGRDYTCDMGYSKAAVRVAGPRWMALYLLETPASAGLWIPEEVTPEFDMVVENFLRIFAAYSVFEEGGAIIHSSCAVGETGAHLFLGRSGAGKSTIAQLCSQEGLQILSDDMNVVTTLRGLAEVERLPFAGSFRPADRTEERLGDRYPLKAVYRLDRYGARGRREIPHSVMAGLAVVCTPFVNVNPFRQEALLERADGLLAKVPCFEIGFGLNEPVLPLLLGGVRS